MARISCQCPSSITTMSAASSHQKSRSPIPRLEAIDAPYATVMATAMSSIIPGWRPRISASPPLRNGRPPTTNTTVPRTGATRPAPGKPQLVAEPVLHHLGEDDHGDGEKEVPPEQAAEQLRMARVVVHSVVRLRRAAVIVGWARLRVPGRGLRALMIVVVGGVHRSLRTGGSLDEATVNLPLQ